MPIDQIISHIANTTLEKQQVVQTPDSQTGAENNCTSAEASRRSSTSTQNTDTLTPTNIPSDPTDNQQETTVASATSAETVVEAHHNIQNDASSSAFKSYQSSQTIQAQMQMQQDTTMTSTSESKESQEQQDVVDLKESGMTKETNASDVIAEISTLTVPARKVSRFLVSPVVEQKNIAAEEESSVVNEGASRALQSINQSIVEPVLKNEEYVTDASVLETSSVNLHEQPSNSEVVSCTNAEQTDSVQQILQQSGQQQSLGMQQSIIQMQTVQQVAGHVQTTTTIGQSKQHTIIMQQGATITSQQMPQNAGNVQHFVPINSQKEMQPPPLHANGIAPTQAQYPTIMQSPAVVMQQQPQQIPMQQSIMQSHIQAADHQSQMQQTQRASTMQQFVPQQVQPAPTQQYVILQPIQPTIDDRNRRASNISIASNVSMDSQLSESSNIPEEKRQTIVTAANIPVATHMQHIQVVPQDMSNAMVMQQQNLNMETAQQTLQTAHSSQNVQHNALGATSVPIPSCMPMPLPVHPVVTDVSTSKVATIKTKEVSSTLPDLAQNLANILSNPKSKSVTPHPLANSHEPTAVPNSANVAAAASTLVDYKPTVQSEQYFQPIQPEANQLGQIQPPVQHNYPGQIVHQGYQGQPNFQQTFPNQQLLIHQNQAQPTQLQSIPLTIPQQIELQSQLMQSAILTGQPTSAQGKWFITTNQSNPLLPAQQQQQQPILRHMQSTGQPFQNQLQLQQIPMQSQVQQQTVQDQHSESSIALDQSHLHLKFLEQQQPAKLLEAENFESSNLNWYVIS